MARARAFVVDGAYADAVEILRRTLPAVERASGAESIEVAELLNELGVACKFAGLFDEAGASYARAVELSERSLGPSELTATLLHNTGGLAHSRHDYEAGVPHARRGLAMREQLEPRDDYGIAADASALAALLEGVGEYSEAERLHLQALPVFVATGDTHEAAMTRNGLGSVCQATDRWDEAAGYYDAAIALFEANEPEHPAFGHVLNNRATLHRRLGEDTAARALLKRAHELLERTLGPEHPVTIEVEGNRRRVDASPSPYV